MIVVALGANMVSHVGTPAQTLRAALAAMPSYGIQVGTVSSFYLTQAWPDPADPPFVNAVAVIRTMHGARDLLQILHDIEQKFGRVRLRKNGPRTLDLDLIAYDGLVMHDQPVLPHPRLSERAFVLVPLAEVAPGWCHPVSAVSVQDMLAALPAGEKASVALLSSCDQCKDDGQSLTRY